MPEGSPGAAAGEGVAAGEGAPTLIDRLERLPALHLSGALDSAEFAEAKKQILAEARSSAATTGSASPAEAEAPSPHPAQSGVSISAAESACKAKYLSMTIDQLKAQCDDAWLSSGGSKPELVHRLVDYEKPSGGWPVGAPPPRPPPPPEQTPLQVAKAKAKCKALVESIQSLRKAHPNNICLSTFDPEYFGSLEDQEVQQAFLRCLTSGFENPDSGMGCYACQPQDYDRFKPFFCKALAKYHKVEENAKHVNNWSLEGVAGIPSDGVLDIAKLGLPEISMRVRVGRNLNAFPLPAAMSQEERCSMENCMLKAFEVLLVDPAYGGKYCSFTPDHPNYVDGAEYQALVDAHIAFKDMSADKYLLSAGIAQHWPHGRGVYISEDKGFIIWVGEEDHLRIMCMKKGTVLNDVFDRLKRALDVVEGIQSIGGFAISEDYGVVTSCPTNLGTGMRASLRIALPQLTSGGSDEKVKEIATPLGLSVRGLGGQHTPIGSDGTVDVSPSARFCITEAEIITALYRGIESLQAAEVALASAKQALKIKNTAVLLRLLEDSKVSARG
eukprot:COSAG05_NODE_1905_length_3849_cov_524.588533_2_plen_557_part_00